jgi:hypothetical protein
MTDMLLNKEVDVYRVFAVSVRPTHIRRQQRRNRVYGVYPRHRKIRFGCGANTVIIKRQNSGKYSIDKATAEKSTRLWLCIDKPSM